jgi:hypothetical protein
VKTLICDETHCWPNEPERIASYPPESRKQGMASKEKLIRLSNLRYTRPRKEIDDEIARFLARPSDASPTAPMLIKKKR